MVTIYYFDWANDPDLHDEFFKLHIGAGGDTVRREDYTRVADDPDATLDTVFARWNRGSGQECHLFERLRICEACDEQLHGQDAAEEHEDVVHDGAANIHAHRSLCVGDVVETEDGLYRFVPDDIQEVEWADEGRAPV